MWRALRDSAPPQPAAASAARDRAITPKRRPMARVEEIVSGIEGEFQCIRNGRKV
jgi:hypothetical protein